MKCYTDVLIKLGFRRGRASVCNFHHSEKNLSLTCHGDDFLVVGSISEIRWLEKEMEKKFEIKINTLGPEVGCVQEMTILNRTLRWNDVEGNIEYEPDARHVEVLIKELGLEGANGLSVPGCDEQS